MNFFKKSECDEKRICSLCEYSTEDTEGFKCGKKRVSPTHCCRRFIYDPLKKKDKRPTFDKSEFTFEALE